MKTTLSASFVTALVFGLIAAGLRAQTVSPVIAEFREKASGRIDLTNNTFQTQVVVLEPKSFTIAADGNGVFRELDPGIHLELSAQSFRLAPRQTYHVFYKAEAEHYPAWFTVYAAFSAPQHGPGLDVRILLPHTVYLYQKQAADREQFQITQATYSGDTHKLCFSVESQGKALARVVQVQATGGRSVEQGAGFPLLPGGMRRVEMKWDEPATPTSVVLHFDHFTLTGPVESDGR